MQHSTSLPFPLLTHLDRCAGHRFKLSVFMRILILLYPDCMRACSRPSELKKGRIDLLTWDSTFVSLRASGGCGG